MSASFEHSTMKNSFSLSSLRSGPAPPGGHSEQLERPYHSLTKKRKEPCREAWRRSWGSAASGGSCGDDLWPLLQHHYEYIMDNQIIDTCKEANGELLSHNSSALHQPRLLNPTTGFNRQWSLSQLIAEFKELCQWLTHVQEEIYSSPENLTSRKLRMNRMSELVSVEPRRVKFMEQADAILERLPEASAEVTWRIEHLKVKWESLRLLLNPEQLHKDGDGSDTVDPGHELRCLRRWLHCMEGRLPPPSLAAARAASYHELVRKLKEHQVLQRDVECHGRIVSSVVRLCNGADAARALERRWHLLYLRAIEWQCHLEACLTRIENQGGASVEVASDSDDEPALKQPRLSRRGSPRQRTPVNGRRRQRSVDSRQSASEEEQEYAVKYTWRGFESDCESELARQNGNMADERRVPGACDAVNNRPTDQIVPVTTDQIDGLDVNNAMHIEEKMKTPPTVIKRKKPVDSSKFNQTDRKSKHCATFYFRHHDTDSDRQMIETDEKSQEESSEEEWTYVGGAKIANEDSTDLMTSSVEIQCELPIDNKDKPPSPKPKLESSTPDLIKIDIKCKDTERCKDIERLVIQAEELVQKQAQQMSKKKGSRSFKPLMFEEEGKSVCRAKMSRIKEWLNQSSEGKDDSNQGAESYDASGEYTTESEVDTSLTSEERNLHSSMDMSTSTCTVTPTHYPKVQLRKKRGGNSARPWSVSCLSQLSATGVSLAATPTAGDVAAMSHNMSISESALNTLASPQRVTPTNSNSKLRGSSTTVQGHVSSTNTMTEACTSCVETNDKQCWLRRKRLKLRRHNASNTRRERLVKSLSFCGRMSPEIEDKNERSAASDPATSRKSRFDTTSTSGNDSDDELLKQQLATIANLRKSIEKTHISSIEPDSAIPEQNEEIVAPSFKLGPAGGAVRPRLARSSERERSFLALSLGDPSELWDLSVDKDSDIDKSVTAGTEEHSSFSEQAWDFYQEKYNSEPYSEAPDSDAARRLLEFGDDYRAFLDSQSDCCSSLSAQPENEQSPSGTRRRRPPSDLSRERSLPRYKRPTRTSPVETPARKPKKSISSAERKKSLLDSLERSRNNTSIESNDGVRRRKPSECSKNTKRSPEFDLLNSQALSRRRHSSNLTSDEINSSLEYTEVNNRPDILDSLNRRRRTERDGETELQKIALSELRRRSTESADSEDESSSPKKHSRRNWDGDSDSEAEEVRSLVRQSSSQLEAAEALMARQDTSPDLLRAFDYTEIVTRCRDNINLLDAALAGGSLSAALQRDIRAVSARWSALRAAATRRGGARRLRREMAALHETLDDICDAGDCATQPHSKVQLTRRIEELKERLSRLLECKVSMLKLTVSVRRALGELESDDNGLAAELNSLLARWDDAHQRTSNELLSLEKAVCVWAEWENAFRELQGALRGDLATLQALRDRGAADGDQTEVAAQIKQLAASLVEKKKGGSTCDSLSDSGISDGDSESAGGRARRLNALRELARRLQAALAPNSPAHKGIAKRMEQTENEVRILQESCRALVEQSIPDLKIDENTKDYNIATVAGNKTGAGDPDYSPRGGWVWRVVRSSLPIQLCLVALLLAAWLVERPRCCDALNSLAQTLTPQLRYVRGPPPV
ncbi:klarsicht protein isoform X1 [Amyelois transitella]|uniref:klarsicht protein isoform X1 n=1 Tax=Amyelois transitella TaxID=680683 RepID=UPI00298FFC1C|nr:klarsicht protein isoform X1 [Amyelois transitella]XP_060806046.1 klarsicht protein isoform X1 [Amyelois transitella]